jgi:enoyl-CoA hydratase
MTGRFQTIAVEKIGAVARLTLNRPERANALNAAMLAEIATALDEIENDADVRALIVRGAGAAFSSGFDLKEQMERRPSGVEAWRAILRKDFDTIMRFWHFPRPTIATVRGPCLAGACELALACDITIAAEGTRFGEPELRFGSGIVALLMPWFAGPKKAKEFLFTGNDRIDAADALACGLVNRVVPAGQELETALAMAREIAVNDRVKMAMTKRAVNRSYEMMGMLAALDMGLDTDILIESLETPEGKTFREIRQREGLKAALAWRDSRFAGSKG